MHNPKVSDKLDPEDFPEQLQMFAADVTTFLDCLNEFPEFTDEAVNAAILSLEGDLKVCFTHLRLACTRADRLWYSTGPHA